MSPSFSQILKLCCVLLISSVSAAAIPMNSGEYVKRTSAADEQAYLDAHNSVRAQHGAVPLTWNDDAAAKAQQWANGCVFQHSGGTLGPYGGGFGRCNPLVVSEFIWPPENLAAGTGDFTIPDAVGAWTDEACASEPYIILSSERAMAREQLNMIQTTPSHPTSPRLFGNRQHKSDALVRAILFGFSSASF
jgi:hypothetical protein